MTATVRETIDRPNAAPGTRTLRDQSAFGCWELVARLPHPRLRAHVREYQGCVEQALRPTRRRDLPSGDVPLIINFGAPVRVVAAGETTGAGEERRAFVAGLHASYALAEWDDLDCLQLNFTPLGAYQFFGVPMHSLTNRAVELEDIFGQLAPRLLERLYAARGGKARFALLEALIAGRLAEARPPAPGIGWAWQRLCETHGSLSISALTEELACSRKHLNAQFRGQIGLAPKILARILRFNRAVRLLDRTGAPCWSQIAHDCDCCDQAHLIRDFKQFAGSTPGELFLRRNLINGGVSGERQQCRRAAGACWSAVRAGNIHPRRCQALTIP